MRNTPSELPSVREEEPPIDEFCHNELFDLLGNRRRRYILGYLHVESSPVKCRKLAEQIAAWENDSTCSGISSSEYQSVYNSLYQTHLPRLESAGLLEYDRSKNLVYPTSQIAEVEMFINAVVPRTSRESLDRPRTMVTGLLLAGFMVGTSFLVLDISLVVVSAVILIALGAFLIGSATG